MCLDYGYRLMADIYCNDETHQDGVKSDIHATVFISLRVAWSAEDLLLLSAPSNVSEIRQNFHDKF